jgi:hypothetical protein
MDYYQPHLSNTLKIFIRIFILIIFYWIYSPVYGFESIKLSPEASLGFPQGIQAGTEAFCENDSFYCSKKLKFFAHMGFFRYPLVGGERYFRAFNFEIGSRIFPFQFPLYLATSVGYRNINVSADVSAFKIEEEIVATSATMRLSTLYFSPGIGWEFSLSRRLTLGVELGVQISLIASGDLFFEDQNTGANSDNSDVLKVQSEKQIGRIAHFILPTLTLFRFTWSLD